MKPQQRWILIGGMLLATLLAGYFAEDEPAPEKGKRAGSASAKTSPSAGVSESRRPKPGDKVAELAAAPLSFPEPVAASEELEAAANIDPFRAKTWYIAPPPPPPPKPTAPPLPFQYLGKLVEAGETRVFLNHQGKQLIARVGDIINGTYSVEEIVGGQMTFLYQPLKEKQVLAIGTDK